MTSPVVVDTHLHLYRTQEEGLGRKEDYEIWEYGKPPGDIHFSDAPGDVSSAVTALDAAGCVAAVVVNMYPGTAAEADAAADLQAFNRWTCDVSKADRRFYPLIAVDPQIMSVDESVSHLEAMVGDGGAQGIKFHPPVQRWDPADQSRWPIFTTCDRLGLRVVAHSGPSRDSSGLGTPDSFRPLLSAYPSLRIVLAHMGGRAWRQLPRLASDYKTPYFDLCEVIEWLGAPGAPSRTEMVDLIRSVGIERVMMGSDFPWYDIAHTAELVRELPGLSTAEQEAILGENAVRFFGIAV